MITENNNKQCPVCSDIMTTGHSNYVPVWSDTHDDIVCIDCKETTETNKVIYFVVAVDVSTGTKYIDDEMLVDRFGGQAFNTDTQEWEKETEEEYQVALSILNNPEWRAE